MKENEKLVTAHPQYDHFSNGESYQIKQAITTGQNVPLLSRAHPGLALPIKQSFAPLRMDACTALIKAISTLVLLTH